MKKALIFLSTYVLLGGAVLAGQKADLTDVPGGPRIAGYLDAFNAGEEKMAQFIKDNVAEAALQERPVDKRLAVYREMHERMKSLQLREVVNVEMSAKEQSVTTLVRTGSGEMVNLTFNFDPQPPNKIISLRVEDADQGPGPGPQNGAGTTPLTESEFTARVKAYLDDLAKKDEFSGALLISHNGKTIFQNAYGFADQETKTPNKTDTKFNLGSINKAFTSICVGQLIQQGKLSLDDKLGKFLPDYPNHEAAEKVTVRQLLTMKSGIGDFFGERYQAADKEKIRSLADYLPLFADKPLLFEPGTQNRYSNGGYIVLGLIIQKVSGQDYYDYVKQHVFEPAGMKDTDFYFSDQTVANRAQGYTRHGADGPGRKNSRSGQPGRGSSAGGGYSTLPDLLNFTKAIADRKLSQISMQTGEPALSGMGIAGGSPGTNAALEFDPEHGNVIIVLSNYDPPSAEAPARQIRGWMRDIKK